MFDNMSVASQHRAENVLWAIATIIFIIISSTLVGLIARQVMKWRGETQAEQRNAFWGFTLSGPWLVGFFIFVLGPALASLVYSFTDYRIGADPHYIGLENYRMLLKGIDAPGERFRRAMFNSFYYTIIGVPLQIIAALVMALLLNAALRAIRVFRMVYYLPVILAASPAALLAWNYMFGSNGGFINLALQRFAKTFFLFDWLYRAFIFCVEGFNGFYAGVRIGDPIGSLKYTFPALLGLLLVLPLMGYWNEGKRNTAQRALEVLGITLVGYMASTGLVEKPVDVSWIYVTGIIVLGGMLVNHAVNQPHMIRLWQVGGCLFLGTMLFITLDGADYDLSGHALQATLALGIASGAVVITCFGAWNRRKLTITGGSIALLGMLILVRNLPPWEQLDVVFKYLTFGSTLDTPGGEGAWEYLNATYPPQLLPVMWIYVLVVAAVAALLTLGMLGERTGDLRYDKARHYVAYGALAFFALFALNSFRDGRAYFKEYDIIAQKAYQTEVDELQARYDAEEMSEIRYTKLLESKQPPWNHFTTFRQRTEKLPESTIVPNWRTDPLWTKPSLILITMWSSGGAMLIFLAALKGVPRSLYEAAEVDGANVFQRFLRITLPMISPAMFYNIVIGVIAALQTFESIYILRTPNTEDSLISAAYFLYQRTFRELEIGNGSAASWILAAVIVTLTAIQFRYSKWVHYEA
ncbi:MAG: sugar ABC transporter permease [Chloroflexi bacterium]|nr:sugar ABC transporter permease [Chloroflexota bacterium]